MKQFVVIGLGNFGYNIAVELVEHGNEVIAIDHNRELVQQIKSKVTLAVYADVKEKQTLEKIIDKNIDIAIVSLGDKLEASIMATLYLKELGIKEIYVKANSSDQAKILKMVGATKTIFPEKELAIKLASQLSNKNVIEFLPLAKGYSIMELAAPKDFHNKTLIDLKLRNNYNVQVIAIKNSSINSINMVPGADYAIQETDNLIIAGKDTDIKKIQKLI